MKNTIKQNEKMVRDLKGMSIRKMEGEGNERKFILSFSSEEPYTRYFGTEILDHTEGCINLDRLKEIGVVLFNNKKDEVIGKVIRVWIKNDRGQAEIEFDSDEESEKIYQKVKNGTLKGVSVGYIVKAWEEVMANKKSNDGRFTGPCSIAKMWEPYEISIVSIPADPSVGVGREMENETKGSTIALYEKQLQINKNKEKIGG